MPHAGCMLAVVGLLFGGCAAASEEPREAGRLPAGEAGAGMAGLPSGTGGANATGGAGGTMAGGVGGAAAGLGPDGAATPPFTGECGTTANLLILLDLSGSMTIELVPGDPSQGTRYTATREALIAALPAEAGVRVGLVYYGHPADVPGCAEAKKGCCTRDSENGGPDIPLQVMSAAHKQGIVDFLDAHDGDALHQTPTQKALEGAYEMLSASEFGGPRYVLLLTDGDENCGGDWARAGENAATAQLEDPPIRTYVVGSPGSEPARQGLSDLAASGGTERVAGCDGSDGNTCHYDLTAAGGALAEQLKQAIAAILAAAAPC